MLRYLVWFAVLAVATGNAACAETFSYPVNLLGHFDEGETAYYTLDLGRSFLDIQMVTVQHSGTVRQNIIDYYPPDPMNRDTFPLECEVWIPGVQERFVYGESRPHYFDPFPYSYNRSTQQFYRDSAGWLDLLSGETTVHLDVWPGSGGWIEIESFSLIIDGTPVPEPSSAAAIAAATCGLLGFRRKLLHGQAD